MIIYDKKIKLIKANKCPYDRFYDPYHPLANKGGLVAYHRHIASIKMGRWLKRQEVVHHINGNKLDNRIENIIVLTLSSHILQHHKERGNYVSEERICLFCKNTFLAVKNYNKYCSVKCYKQGKRRFNITKDELTKLVWEKSCEQIAREYSVTSVAISKRCKLYGIKKPPRGYWAKQYAKYKQVVGSSPTASS